MRVSRRAGCGESGNERMVTFSLLPLSPFSPAPADCDASAVSLCKGRVGPPGLWPSPRVWEEREG
eukprot:6613301-Prorocentrum_lima.AAC.1